MAEPRNRRPSANIAGMPWAWDLDAGNVSLFGLPSVAFWTRPSLERLLGPLREEVGNNLYRLLVAHYSSMGTDEDYHAMITELGQSFEEGFLAWGDAVSTAGWGRFFLAHIDHAARVAVIRVENPWELQMQGQGEDWGCPFLQGKIIGIFNHAFGVNCWAHERNVHRDAERGCSIEFHVAPSKQTIGVELDKLRRARMRERERELAEEVERKTAALRAAEERQRAVLSSLSDLVFTVDTAGRIEQYIPPGDRSASFPAVAQALHRPVSEVFGSSLAAALATVLASHATIGATQPPSDLRSLEFELELGGQSRCYDAHFSPRNDADGIIDGLTIVLRDVTQQRLLEAQLRHSQKMDSVGQLAGGIAHDFNNILAGIIGAADLLALQAPPELQDLIDTVISGSETAAGVIQGLLDFSRKGQRVSTSVHVHALISDTVELLSRSVDRRILVLAQLDAESSRVRGDPHQLKNALINLGVNARDAMGEGGEVRFSTRNVILGSDELGMFSGPLAPGPYLEIDVCDTGEGMDSATKARIFEPFFTTKVVGSGTGLGLSAVYGAVNDHKGAIDVYSELGKGTTFKLRLPLDVQRRDLVPDTIQLQPRPQGHGRILLVDDEPIIRTVGEQILRKLGYEVVTAEDGQAGVERYREQGDSIDLVILDMVMPRMNGRDTLLALRELDPNVRVLFSSGFSNHGLIPEVQGFVKKPYRLQEIADAVAKALLV